MPKQVLYVGETTRLMAVFSPAAKDGNPDQPVTITVLQPDSSKDPDGVTAQVASPSTFYHDFPCTQVGDHIAEFVSADGAIETYDFTVEPNPV